MLTERNPYDPEQVGHYELDRLLLKACLQGQVRWCKEHPGCYETDSDADTQRINMVGGAIRARIDGAMPRFKPGDVVAPNFASSHSNVLGGPSPWHFSTDTGTDFRIERGKKYTVENIFYEGNNFWLLSFEGIKSDRGLIIKYKAVDFALADAEKAAA
ncbi:MAG: hypothetical protein UV72_C0024G0004 [Candidatus Giovannonibacteria bacterium GW2011_GWB1_43_13]|nr:MAG: hypothetical protein UV72_C0024G0004 [Candidatus Giovannonibacteria bacterium GW2011_GWB1_43_13]